MPKDNNRKIDWKRELQRQEVLQLRDERWRANSRHVMKLLRNVAMAWFLLRHGIDLTEVAASFAQDTLPPR